MSISISNETACDAVVKRHLRPVASRKIREEITPFSGVSDSHTQALKGGRPSRSFAPGPES